MQTTSAAPQPAPRPATGGFLNLGLASVLPGVLRELGIDPDPILTDAGLSRRLLTDGSSHLSVNALGKLLRLCAERAACPHIGLVVGEKVTLSAFDDLGSLMRVSETFGDALRVLASYRRLQSQGAVFTLARKGDLAVLSYLPYQAGERTGLIAECALAIVTQVLRDLCGPGWSLAEVLMPRRTPADQSPYRSLFRCSVWFDQETATLVFPARLLSTRLTGSEGEVRRALEHNLRRAEANARSDLIDDLRQILRTEMRSGRCSANGMARQLAIHKRTLARHL